jgi:hypothetical protein
MRWKNSLKKKGWKNKTEFKKAWAGRRANEERKKARKNFPW